MQSKFVSISALTLVTLLLFGGMASVVGAAPIEDQLDRIQLQQGATKEFGGGNFVAINMTQGDNAAWFGVLYGTMENPAPITLVGAYVRYLGGAEVTDENGGMMLPAVPIPVLTVFFQQLDALIEFNDTGYISQNLTRLGAENALFDFAGNRSMDNFGINSCEPVYKVLELKQGWQLSEIKETVDVENSSKHYEFSLSAQDLLYSKVFDNKEGSRNPDGSRAGTVEDGMVENLEFDFHVDAVAQTMTADVPWYQVSVNSQNQIIDSKQVESRTYTGVSVNAAFKYDQIIEGWDYDSQSSTSKLMLENIVFFGTFVPSIVQQWIDAQFIGKSIPNGDGSVSYRPYGKDQDSSAIPEESTKVAKNKIEFKDNWQRVGTLEWISNVTVDGHDDIMYYQIHAGSRLDGDTLWAQSKEGEVKGLVAVGGYIYPAGSNIMHDPTFASSTFLAQINGKEAGIILLLLMMGAVIACVSAVVVVSIFHRKSRRSEFRYDIPPQYRKP